jgi:RNA polymerase sigma-70 factor (ECF subfamily)
MAHAAANIRPRLPVLRLHRMAEASNAPTSQPADADLIARALGGEAHAFELIVRRHYGPAFAVALAVMANRSDAEDICHDALVNALARLEDCRQPDRFAQWLAAIVRNRARNQLVSAAVRRSAPLDQRMPSAGDLQSHTVERDDLRRALEAALAQLTPVQREVVLLHDLHDWPHEEIAEAIGTSAGMSRQHLFKARRNLRKALGPHLLQEYFDD